MCKDNEILCVYLIIRWRGVGLHSKLLNPIWSGCEISMGWDDNPGYIDQERFGLAKSDYVFDMPLGL